MWQAVLAMDGSALASVAVKSLAYLASLAAAGSSLAFVGLTKLDADTARRVRRLGAASALAAALFSLALVPMGVIFLNGGAAADAFDPILTRMVVEGPLGESLAVRVAGLALILLLVVENRVARLAAVPGALLVCASFAFRGHVLADPRLVLGILVTVHILGICFWLGAFFPLHRMARYASQGEVGAAAEEFGRKAVWVVGGLATAGVGLLVVLTQNPFQALSIPYGQLMVVKLTLFVPLLALAAFNKLRLTPALLIGDVAARSRLGRSIELEFTVACAIVVTTATLTTIASPQTAI